jgi:hypothetical protein
MCYAKPGPRCSAHTSENLKAALDKIARTLPTFDQYEVDKATADFDVKLAEFNTTRAGQEYLEKRIATLTANKVAPKTIAPYIKMLADGKQVQKARIDAYKNGGPEVPVIITKGQSSYYGNDWIIQKGYFTEESHKEMAERRKWSNKADENWRFFRDNDIDDAPKRYKGQIMRIWEEQVNKSISSQNGSLDPTQPIWKNRFAARRNAVKALSKRDARECGEYLNKIVLVTSQKESKQQEYQKSIKGPSIEQRIKSLTRSILSKTPNKVSEF